MLPQDPAYGSLVGLSCARHPSWLSSSKHLAVTTTSQRVIRKVVTAFVTGVVVRSVILGASAKPLRAHLRAEAHLVGFTTDRTEHILIGP